MAKGNSEITSKRTASAAGKILRNPKTSASAKTAAASSVTQRPSKSVSSVSKRELRASAEKYEDALERLAKR
jgi:hypothetical protein